MLITSDTERDQCFPFCSNVGCQLLLGWTFSLVFPSLMALSKIEAVGFLLLKRHTNGGVQSVQAVEMGRISCEGFGFTANNIYRQLRCIKLDGGKNRICVTQILYR